MLGYMTKLNKTVYKYYFLYILEEVQGSVLKAQHLQHFETQHVKQKTLT